LRKRILFEKAEKKWGLKSQLDMLAEESAELAVAALHITRALKDKDQSRANLVKEIADVQICIEQIIQILDLFIEVENSKEWALERLENLLEAL
jgi:NTP pyrophosphatase (non-canonical NTP hydrolase)